MTDPPNHRDVRAMGGNPCLEQTLESFEMCCLVETFPDKHDSLDDFLETLRLKICGIHYKYLVCRYDSIEWSHLECHRPMLVLIGWHLSVSSYSAAAMF